MRTNRIVLFFSASFCFILMEIGLRNAGFSPGKYSPAYYFDPVTSLIPLQGYLSNNVGIMTVDSKIGDEIKCRITCGNDRIPKNEKHEISLLTLERLKLLNRRLDNEFSKTYFRLKTQKGASTRPFDLAFLKFVECPINSDGFRSIPFQSIPNTKPSVLLLGDSFTWGMSASNISNSFADILLARGYTVYNTGISATDVAQYEAVAKKYIPLLKPDFVIANFYLGNDITYYEREIRPNQPAFYCTNAGVLMANPHGQFLNSAEKAYDLTYRHYCIPKNVCLFNDVMSLSAIGTVIWLILNNGNISYDAVLTNYYKKVELRKHKLPVSNRQLLNIKRIAKEYNSKFILSSIPTIDNEIIRYARDFPDLFADMKYHEMQVELEDYKLADGHFNDLGHLHYANFLQSIIDGKK